MTAGILIIVSIGPQDVYITGNPQITFFKIMYRRHTNFSTEPIPQYFSDNIQFGKKSSCILSKNGDLIHRMYVVLVLPKIVQFVNDDGSTDNITKFAWRRYIGYQVIKNIEIEIGNQKIDKHYGEWLYILHELFEKTEKKIDSMIGNMKILTDYSNGKESYTLYIPLKFWFCRMPGNALPLVSLTYNDVKINLELTNFYDCCLITPTYYIQIAENLVSFEDYEYIEQNIDGVISIGEFSYFDPINKYLYYRKISIHTFKAYTSTGDVTMDNHLNNKYVITGKKTNHVVHPLPDMTEKYYEYNKLSYNDIKITSCYLLVDYIFLDQEERLKFSKKNHEYLIDQLQYVGQYKIEGINRTIKIGTDQLIKYIVWVGQQYFVSLGDSFNYTDDYQIEDDKYVGTNLIKSSTLLFNGHERLSFRKSEYYNWVQPYQHFYKSPKEGLNVYSFFLLGNDLQPSGSCNMSKIDNVSLKVSMSPNINFSNYANIRIYSQRYNILKIVYGYCGIVFTN